MLWPVFLPHSCCSRTPSHHRWRIWHKIQIAPGCIPTYYSIHDLSSDMAEAESPSLLFERFSAETVATALADTPVLILNMLADFTKYPHAWDCSSRRWQRRALRSLQFWPSRRLSAGVERWMQCAFASGFNSISSRRYEGQFVLVEGLRGEETFTK